MGEVDAAETPARKIEDPSALNVDPDNGERLYKSAIIHTKQGTTYRMVAKMLPIGKLDIVHSACDLLPDGTPEGKRRVNRILAVLPQRFDSEIDYIQKVAKGNGEEVQSVWVHDMTGLPSLTAQAHSLEEWTKKMAAEINRKPS